VDILFLEVVLDLDKCIFPHQTCFICGITLRVVLHLGKYGILFVNNDHLCT